MRRFVRNRWLVEKLGGFVGEIIIFFSRRKYKIALENVSLSFPNKDRKCVESVVRESFHEFGKCIVELLGWTIGGLVSRDIIAYLRWLLSGLVEEDISGQVITSLDKNGGLVLTGHFSNFLLVPLWLVIRKRKVGVVLKKMRNRVIQGILDFFIKKAGIVPLYVSDTGVIRKVRNLFSENGVIIALLDQHFGRKGRVSVKFFGRDAYSASGIVRLAKMYSKDIVCMFVCRKRSGFRIFDMGFLDKVDEGNGMEVEDIVVGFNHVLESLVSENPGGWAWMHRRWKVD